MAQIAMVGLMGLGTALSVAGNLKAATAEKQNALFQAQEAKDAAGRADFNAVLARESSIEDVSRVHLENAKVLGEIRNAYGASGVTMDGSPQAYLDSQMATAKANEVILRNKGILEAKAYRDQASGYRSQAANFARQAGDIESAGVLNAIGAGVSGLAKIGKSAGFGAGGRSSIYSGTTGNVPTITRGK